MHPAPPRLDGSQRSVIELALQGSVVVLGAPGSGKTTTLVELVADRVLGAGWSPDSITVLTAARDSATRLRDRLAARLALPTTGPLARSVGSLAFELVRASAAVQGAPSPRLMTGGEQDADLAELLAGDRGDWPSELPPEVRSLRGFRAELRELMARATEFGVTPRELAELGRTGDRPQWVAAAGFIERYLTVVSTSRPDQFDAAELAQFAAAAIERADPGDLASRMRLVLLDDAQEATESTFTVLRALARRGIPIVAAGDPDLASTGFRGAEPDALARLAAVIDVPGIRTVRLSTAHRQRAALRAVTAAVTARIGSAAAGTHRRVEPGPGSERVGAPAAGERVQPTVATLIASSDAALTARIAGVLRRAHLLDGVPWDEMAVVVRSGAAVARLTRSLAGLDVPTRAPAVRRALRDDAAVLGLLRVLDIGSGRAELDADSARELLLGPFGGLDALGLRRLRLALRREELAGGGRRSADELLVEALAGPGRLATLDHALARAAERMAVLLAEVRGSGWSLEEALWRVWSASGLVERWAAQSRRGGPGGLEADRHLDGVVALFAAAKRFAERRIDALLRAFLDEVLGSDIDDDVISAPALGRAVLVSTPSGVIGREFGLVVVATLQEGVWPNLRPRGSLLSPQELVRVSTGADSGTIDERRLVLDDELRMFALAVSRASDRLVLAAVEDDDQAPSRFLSLLPGGVPDLGAADDAAAEPASAWSLRQLVGELRARLGDPETDAAERSAAAATLAALAQERVVGADPGEWLGLLDPSTTEPLFADAPVPVSPSRVELIEDSSLDWFLETVAASEPGIAANIGTVLHWAMETVAEPSIEALERAVDERWPEIDFEAPWLATRHRNGMSVFVAALAEYLRDVAAEGWRVASAEGRFALDLGGVTVSGAVDRVEVAPGGAVRIVDLKTGNPITSERALAEHPQLLAYQLAYAEGMFDAALAEAGADEHRRGGAALLYVKKGVRGKRYRLGAQKPLDDAALESFRQRLRDAADRIARADFTGPRLLDRFAPGDRSGLALLRVPEITDDRR